MAYARVRVYTINPGGNQLPTTMVGQGEDRHRSIKTDRPKRPIQLHCHFIVHLFAFSILHYFHFPFYFFSPSVFGSIWNTGGYEYVAYSIGHTYEIGSIIVTQHNTATNTATNTDDKSVAYAISSDWQSFSALGCHNVQLRLCEVLRQPCECTRAKHSLARHDYLR